MDEYENEPRADSREEEANKSPSIKGGWLRAILLLLSFILVERIFSMIATAVLLTVSNVPLDTLQNALAGGQEPKLLLIHQTFSLGGAFLLVWFFRTWIDRKDLRSMGTSIRARPLLAGILLGPLMMGLVSLVLNIMGHLELSWYGFDPALFTVHFLLMLLVAVKEELLFRGYVLNNLLSSTTPFLALLLSALAFMLLHIWNPGITPIAVLNIFLAGLLLGVTYIRDRDLAFPIGLHLGWNFAQGHLFGFSVSGMALNKGSVLHAATKGPSYLTGGEFGLEGSLVLASLQVLLIPSLYWVWKKLQ